MKTVGCELEPICGPERNRGSPTRMLLARWGGKWELAVEILSEAKDLGPEGPSESYGGESGIRTHVTRKGKHAFQACAFSHSAISPRIDN